MIEPRQSVLAISGRDFGALCRHLYPGDGKEAVAVALCGKSCDERRYSLLVHELHLIPYSDCRVRTSDQVTWQTESILPLLRRAMNDNLLIVKFHSHPTGYMSFSHADDTSDSVLFDSVRSWVDDDDPMASVVVLPDETMFGRLMTVDGIGEPIDEFRVVGDDFIYQRPTLIRNGIPSFGLRTAQVFGEKTYEILRQLRIGVVGCSGTGSIVVEQLARYGVGSLVLVDNDVVEEKNLNRILNSTVRDAEAMENKALMMKRSVDAIGIGTQVTAIPLDIMHPESIAALASCDLLFGCVDSIDGRHVLNKLASYYILPLIDLGVRIDADGDGGVERICGAIHTIQPGGSSLMSRRVYDQAGLDAAFLKKNAPEEYANRLREGYIRGAQVDRPAVISVNMNVASTAVLEALARIHPFRVEKNGAFAVQRIVLSDPTANVHSGDGEPCPAFSRWTGLGARRPLLGLVDLA